ncbi:ERN2, partial [Symbiodinium microadriaticum]
MARSQVDRRATDTHTENFENSLGTVTSLQSVDRCDSSRTSGKCGIETLQPARNAHRGEALSPIHLKCPHAQELRVASIDVLYGRSMPQCNDTMSDRTHFNGVVALGTQSVKSTGVSVFIRQKAECDICTQIYLDSEPSEDGSALVPLESYLQRTPRPLIDRTNGNYVYIKSTPEGGSYAVEVARQDFSPLVRLQFASDVGISRRGANVIASANECFRQEFCERSGDPEEVDVDVSLCPLNGSVASQTKAKVHPWFGYDMIQVTGVQYQMAAVQEALLRGNDVLEISLCGMRLLCALLFAAIRAAALAVGAAIALVSMLRCWGWGGERGALVRRMLQRLVAVVEDHPVDMSPSAAVSPTLHDERVVTIQSLSESDEVEASKRLAHLVIFEKEELGRGSNGTVVLKGMLEGKRQVAVKKMLSRFQNTIDREIAILSKVDDPNVVRYFQSYRSGDFHFLVLELCHMSL